MKFLSILLVLSCLPAFAQDWRAKDRGRDDQGGIFYEPSPTMSDDDIHGAFRFACRWNQNAPPDLMVPQLVIPYVGYWTGTAAKFYDRELRIAAQYFDCFERVFIGTSHVDVPEGEAAAREFLLSGALARAHRAAARQLLPQLDTYFKWSDQRFHWYVPIDGRLDELSPEEGPIRGAGYARSLNDALATVIRELRDREAHGGRYSLKRIMWSPRFARKYGDWLERKRPGGKLARVEITEAFGALLKNNSALTDLVLLDDSGRTSAFRCEGTFCFRYADQPPPLDCEADTVPYFKLLAGELAYTFVQRMGVGLELQYGKILPALSEKGWAWAPGQTPIPFAEVERRRRCLARNKIPFGPAYELRFLHAAFRTAGEETLRYQFFDVPKGSAYFDSVRTLVERGIAWPCGDQGHFFCPEKPISRADAAVYLYRAKFGAWAREEAKSAGPVVFADVKIKLGQRLALETLAAAGALEPCGKKRLCPDAKITRAEFLRAILVLRGEKPLAEGALSFADVKLDGAFAPWLRRAEARDLALPCEGEGRRFCPDAPLRRGDLAEFIHRGLFGL